MSNHPIDKKTYYTYLSCVILTIVFVVVGWAMTLRGTMGEFVESVKESNKVSDKFSQTAEFVRPEVLDASNSIKSFGEIFIEPIVEKEKEKAEVKATTTKIMIEELEKRQASEAEGQDAVEGDAGEGINFEKVENTDINNFQ
ncbi:MAG: hypothetical protein ABIH21_02770 [Patescibacteria group bacterium]